MNRMATVFPIVTLVFLMGIMAVAIAVTPASNWTAGVTEKYSASAAGGFATEGGNVTPMSVYSNQSTSKWAGVYGNVSGAILLAKNSTVIFYTWTWTPINGAEICASTNSTFSAITANGTAAAVDTAWGFVTASDTDQAVDTMTSTCTLSSVTSTDITGSASVNTSLVSAATETCVAKQNTGTAKASYVFCAPVIGAGFTFDGLLRNYALMLPTATSGAETYYFYLELI